jgi:hypothetical protein
VGWPVPLDSRLFAMNPRITQSSRRRFLQQTVLATGASVLGFPAVVSSRSPNGRLNVGIIGRE